MSDKHTQDPRQSTTKTDPKKHGFSIFKLVLGAVAATGAAGASYYYVTHKEEVDAAAKKKINEMAGMLKESKAEVEKKVAKVWGKVSKDAVKSYNDIRTNILKSLQAENLEKHGEMLRKRYDEIVEKVIKQARKSGILTPEVEKKLEQIYKMDWNDYRIILQAAFKEAKKAAVQVKNVAVKQVSSKKTGGAKKSSKPAKKVVAKKSIKKAVKKTGRRK